MPAATFVLASTLLHLFATLLPRKLSSSWREPVNRSQVVSPLWPTRLCGSPSQGQLPAAITVTGRLRLHSLFLSPPAFRSIPLFQHFCLFADTESSSQALASGTSQLLELSPQPPSCLFSPSPPSSLCSHGTFSDSFCDYPKVTSPHPRRSLPPIPAALSLQRSSSLTHCLSYLLAPPCPPNVSILMAGGLI